MRIAAAERRWLRRELRGAQELRCPYCGEDLPRRLTCGPDCATFDHVEPARVPHRAYSRHQREGLRDQLLIRNALLVHSHCNRAKANRRPTACELIWLAAVNLALASVWAEIEHRCREGEPGLTSPHVQAPASAA